VHTSDRKLRRRWVSQGLLTLVLLNSPVSAQRPPDIKLDADTNRQVVEGVIRAINKYYVSAEIARRVDERLRLRLKNGEYDKIRHASLPDRQARLPEHQNRH